MSFITADEIPGASFDSREALLEYASHAIAVEKFCAAYQAGGDEFSLWRGLSALGFTREQIRCVIANPAQRPSIHYSL